MFHGSRKAYIQWKRRKEVRLESLIDRINDQPPLPGFSGKYTRNGYRIGDEVRICTKIKWKKDLTGTIVYIHNGPKEVLALPLLLSEEKYWHSPEAMQEVWTVPEGRVWPTRAMFRGRGVMRFPEIWGPFIVRVTIPHKTTGRSRLPWFVNIHPLLLERTTS